MSKTNPKPKLPTREEMDRWQTYASTDSGTWAPKAILRLIALVELQAKCIANPWAVSSNEACRIVDQARSLLPPEKMEDTDE